MQSKNDTVIVLLKYILNIIFTCVTDIFTVFYVFQLAAVKFLKYVRAIK